MAAVTIGITHTCAHPRRHECVSGSAAGFREPASFPASVICNCMHMFTDTEEGHQRRSRAHGNTLQLDQSPPKQLPHGRHVHSRATSSKERPTYTHRGLSLIQSCFCTASWSRGAARLPPSLLVTQTPWPGGIEPQNLSHNVTLCSYSRKCHRPAAASGDRPPPRHCRPRRDPGTRWCKSLGKGCPGHVGFGACICVALDRRACWPEACRRSLCILSSAPWVWQLGESECK